MAGIIQVLFRTHTSGRKTFGNSLIVSPWGEEEAKKEGVDSGVIYADVDLAKRYEIRKTIPVAELREYLRLGS